MGVAVLSPEKCLRDGFPHQHRHLISLTRSKPRRSFATHVANPPQNRSGRRKQQRSPTGSPPPPPLSSALQSKPNNVGKAFQAKSPAITGQVRILKRGEELPLSPTKQSIAATAPVKDRKTKEEGSVDPVNSDSVVCLTDWMSPKPVPAPNSNRRSGFYAGSAFFTSPPPSSVPLPAFFTKKIGAGAGVLTKSSAEDAAVDLRRILRLE